MTLKLVSTLVFVAKNGFSAQITPRAAQRSALIREVLSSEPTRKPHFQADGPQVKCPKNPFLKDQSRI